MQSTTTGWICWINANFCPFHFHNRYTSTSLHFSVSILELRQLQMELEQLETATETATRHHVNTDGKSETGRGRRGRPKKKCVLQWAANRQTDSSAADCVLTAYTIWPFTQLSLNQHGFVDTVFALFICFKAAILNSFQNIALTSDLTFGKIQSTVTILFKYLRSWQVTYNPCVANFVSISYYFAIK